MNVFLLRHGDALRESGASGRPLSLRGRGEAEMMAVVLAGLGIGIPLIHHSEKLRARETAEIVASHLGPGSVTEPLPGLLPGDDPEIVGDRLERERRTLLLTGHLPHLARLFSLLTTGDPERSLVQLPTGGLIALGREGARWRLLWMLHPTLLDRVTGRAKG